MFYICKYESYSFITEFVVISKDIDDIECHNQTY